MVEHRPVKAIVVGSNPTSGAILRRLSLVGKLWRIFHRFGSRTANLRFGERSRGGKIVFT